MPAMSRLKLKLQFADFWHPRTEKEIRANYLYQFLERYYDLELSENPDFFLYSVYGVEYLKYDCLRIHYTPENTRPNFRKCDYAFSFDLGESERNIRLPYYKFAEGFSELGRPRRPDAVIAENRGFCSFVNSNNEVPDRLRFFDALSRYKRVDAGGKSRNNIGYLVGDKNEFLRRYKFTIAFENSCHPGYTTEKLMQALVADTVPIYWGNPAVAVDFNPAAFINCHDYDSFDAVIARVREVDADEALYRSYLAAPVFPGGRPNECLDDGRIHSRVRPHFHLAPPLRAPLRQKNSAGRVFLPPPLPARREKMGWNAPALGGQGHEKSVPVHAAAGPILLLKGDFPDSMNLSRQP